MNLPLEPITLKNWPFELLGIAFGQGARLHLEVLYSKHDRTPSSKQLRSAWKARQGRRGVPLLIVVLHQGKANVCGPSGENPTVYLNLNSGQVERICQEALEQPSRQTALRSLRDSLLSLEGEGLPGLRNEGFLANHELTNGVPNRADWILSNDKAQRILSHTGKTLLVSLGFTVERLDGLTNILKVGSQKNAVAILLTNDEIPELGSERIPGSLSPVSYALARADEENLDWVVLLRGRKIRLYPVKTGIGVGRKGRTETYLECHIGLIPDDKAAYIWLLFSADALTEGGSLESIIADSRDFAGNLASRLRERIYDEVIPRLSEGLARARRKQKPTAQQLAETYEMSMTVLFRLLFVAYGEDKNLLPYRSNILYQTRSLKTKARELLKLWNSGEEFGEEDTWWQEVKSIFHAIDKGNSSWDVPAYNGGLFSSNPQESSVGAALENVSLPNNIFGPALQHLLLVPTTEGILGPVDFRSLGVREFGTIYEGLLESGLFVAETDLALETTGKNQGTYRPTEEGEKAVVSKGKIYLHNKSGVRKSTGSYYTKQFAVEYLLEQVLEPALDKHFLRLDDLDEPEAAEAFFDFRVADIAMGSGHFLVTAIDRIEVRFSSYLSKRNLPLVTQVLERLRKAASEALGDAADSYPDFEDNVLLRRLIARRCIYGVDLNRVSVQLARLAIWIHTFVPGLPLSLLDRNLVQGNSLMGVGQLSEIEERVREEGAMLFALSAQEFVGDANLALSKLGRLLDSNHTEIKQARKAWAEADEAISSAKALCDILTVARIENKLLPFDFTRWQEEKEIVVGGTIHQHALSVLAGINPLHFPIVFPEVFLRQRPGFDVVIGNPPWEKVRVEEHAFWARFEPGLRGLSARAREAKIAELRATRKDLLTELKRETEAAQALRQALSKGPFPGMGTGDPDLYKAFCWRIWQVLSEKGGIVGVVLPRNTWISKGSAPFRKEVFSNAKRVNVVVLINKKGWVFPGVHEQNPVPTLNILERSESQSSARISMRGPYTDLASFEKGSRTLATDISSVDVLSWTDSAALPLFPSKHSVEVFLQLRRSPRFDFDELWSVAPHRELDATNDKPLMDIDSKECPEGFWPVYKGASFNLWEPDTRKYYAWGNPDSITPILQKKRLASRSNKNSVFSKCNAELCADPATLPCQNPRIAFRDVTNRTNRRTLISCLIPPNTFLNHKAPYLVFSRGSQKYEAFLLGVLSSIVLDWYARCFVEASMTFFIFNSFPIPRPEAANPLRLRVIELAGRLACIDRRFENWGNEVGVECGLLNPEEKESKINELDAIIAHLYGLTKKHIVHIFETFHENWDYDSRLEKTLEYYRSWSR